MDVPTPSRAERRGVGCAVPAGTARAATGRSRFQRRLAVPRHLARGGGRKARWRRWIAITAGGLIASDGSRDALASHARHFTEWA